MFNFTRILSRKEMESISYISFWGTIIVLFENRAKKYDQLYISLMKLYVEILKKYVNQIKDSVKMLKIEHYTITKCKRKDPDIFWSKQAKKQIVRLKHE